MSAISLDTVRETCDKVAIGSSLHCGECFHSDRTRGNLCETCTATKRMHSEVATQFSFSRQKNNNKFSIRVSTKFAAPSQPLESIRERKTTVLPRGLL